MNYRKKYNSKLKLKSKYANLFESDCHNINTSQELSPLADRSHYKSPFKGKNSLDEVENHISVKSEKHNLSVCSKNSKNSKKSQRNFLNASLKSDKNNSKMNNKIKKYEEKLNYSRGAYEDNILRRSRIANNKPNKSVLSNRNSFNDNKSENEDDEEFTSKRVADIIKKTENILGRSASREFKSKKNTKNGNNNKSNRIITVLKTEKTFQADNCNELEQESDENQIEYNEHSDIERKIKPKGFNEYSDVIADANKSLKKRKKSGNKIKSKSKSKGKLKKNSNYIDNLLTFTNNDNSNSNSTNLINNYDTASRVSSRKMKNIYGNNASRISTINRVVTGSNRSFSINTYGNVKTKSNIEQKDKEKILKLKERNNELKLALKSERKKQEDIEKRLKKIKFKEENFDCLEKNFIALRKEFEKMQKNYNQSELIRKEQAKLIKSMKYEIDILKGER